MSSGEKVNELIHSTGGKCPAFSEKKEKFEQPTVKNKEAAETCH